MAHQLYTGPLASARINYARTGRYPFWIVSAGLGLVDPNSLVRPYDKTIKDLPLLDQRGWALGVVHELLDELPNCIVTARQLLAVHIELHMGADYAELLIQVIRAVGMSYSWPVKGMSQGAQLAYYKERRCRS